MNGLTTERGDLDPGSAFVPDVLTPVQYYDQRRNNSANDPVKRLMLAVLEDALRLFQNNAGGDATVGHRKLRFMEAEEWLYGTGGEGPFSFEAVCETLGIEPGFLRRGLREWRAQQLAGIVRRPLARHTHMVLRTGRISASVPRLRRPKANTA
jgi:hypothetical protein